MSPRATPISRAISVFGKVNSLYDEMLAFDTSSKRTSRNQTVWKIRRLREMDEKVMSKKDKIEKKIEIMIGIAAALCDVMEYNESWVEKWTGWGEGSIEKLRNKYPGRWNKAVHLACDNCFDKVHRQRVRFAARLLGVAEEASKVIECAVLGKQYTPPGEDDPIKVTKDQRLAAQMVGEALANLDRDIKAEALLLLQEDDTLSEKEEIFERTADRMELDKMLSRVDAARRTA